MMDRITSPADDNTDHQLSELLSGINTSDTSSTSSLPVWDVEGVARSFRATQTLNSSGNPQSPPALPLRTSSRIHQSSSKRSTSHVVEHSTEVDPSTTPTQFEPPLRSIFASGQPTSSISANTAQASLSSAASRSISRPLVALTSPHNVRRTPIRSVDCATQSNLVNQSEYGIPGTHKDVDDPTLTFNGSHDRTKHSHALAGLFTAGDGSVSAPLSRHTTYGRSSSNMQRMTQDTSTLDGHLLHLGFIEGRHSDITVHAFGQQYKLHKLLLERIPFFSAAFSPPWVESNAREMTLMPEDMDPNITKAAFELALKRVYGTTISVGQEDHAISLFATASWLDMPDLIDISIEQILRQMRCSDLHILIKLVTSNYYGKPGDRILSSAKAMLCRDGWEMPYEYWDEIPSEIICEVIGGDPFYIPDEWERWYLTVKVLNRRLRKLATAHNLITAEGRYRKSRPAHLSHIAIRISDDEYERRATVLQDDPWAALYSNIEIVPLLQLLDSGIHYVHLRFEQLQHIKYQKDILGVPLLPEKVISDALWALLELRQLVLNAHEGDEELGLSQSAEGFEETLAHLQDDSKPCKEKGTDLTYPSSSCDGSDLEASAPKMPLARRFWIPTTDISCVMGGSSEAYTTASLSALPEWKHRSQRLSATFEATDVTWPPGLGDSMHSPPARQLVAQSVPRFSRYPPFRFCAEFPNPRTLKERKKVYSQTVWYAGSFWNLYLQRIHTSKNQQLGIYLHRTKDRDPSDDALMLTVDDRIGQLERDLLLRKSERRRKHAQGSAGHGPTDPDSEDHPIQEHEGEPNHGDGDSREFSNGTATGSRIRTSATSSHPKNHSRVDAGSVDDTWLRMSDDESESNMQYLRSSAKHTISTVPPYTDPRSSIKTYFKIYSPSKAGRLLCVYESAPDNFNFGKSWGWKSSQMVLDDSIGDELTGESSMKMSGDAGSGIVKDGKLRYMVCLGNV